MHRSSLALSLGSLLLLASPLWSQRTAFGPGCSGPVSRDPAWSPDGRALTFVSNRSGSFEVWIRDLDGEEPRRVTTTEGDAFYPRFSPDGATVAFTEILEDRQRVVVASVANGALEALTSFDDSAADPSWLPGGRIVFSSASGGARDLWVSDVSGIYRQPLFRLDGDEWAPRVSPNGERLLFHSDADGDFDVYTVRLDGSDLRRLSNDPGFDGVASWSADGSSVVYYGREPKSDATSEAAGANWATAEIKVVAATGGASRRLTQDQYRDQSPSWSPDGGTIAYTSCAGGNLEVWLMDAGGENRRQLTKTPPAPSSQAAQDVSVAAEGSATETLRGRRDALLLAIDSYMRPHVANGDFSGSIRVSKDGKVWVNRAFGFAKSRAGSSDAGELRYNTASLSKPLTAVGVMLLIDTGTLSLHEPLATFVPEFPNGDQITVHNLLTHTSGIPDINRLPAYRALSVKPQTPRSLLKAIADASGEARPGRYRYSNSNYNLLALIIEIASGQSYGDFMAQRIFEPLGLRHTAHAGSNRERELPAPLPGQIPEGLTKAKAAPTLDWSSKPGNGSIVSTTEDLGTFLRRLGNRPILSARAMQAMLTPQVGRNKAYGWFVGVRFGQRVVYMNGHSPGFNAAMEYYPAEDLAVVVLGNLDIALASSIARDLGAMAFSQEIEDPKERLIHQPEGGIAFEDYEGRYEFGVGFELAYQDGSLRASGAWPRYPVTLVPVAKDVFFHRFWQSELVFERGPDGDVSAMRWGQRSAHRQPL